MTANTESAVKHMADYCATAKLCYLPNPIVVRAGNHQSRDKVVLFLARLVPQKGPDVLVDAFAKFVGEHPDWSLQFAGDGPMARELIERVGTTA